MHAYGLPRSSDVTHPDVMDLHEYGLKSSKGRLANRNGEHRSYIKNANQKQIARRRYKRQARAEAKSLIQHEIAEYTV